MHKSATYGVRNTIPATMAFRTPQATLLSVIMGTIAMLARSGERRDISAGLRKGEPPPSPQEEAQVQAAVGLRLETGTSR